MHKPEIVVTQDGTVQHYPLVYIVIVTGGRGSPGLQSVWFTEEEALADKQYKEDHYAQTVLIKVFQTGVDFGWLRDILPDDGPRSVLIS